MAVTQERLRSLFEYDPNTGYFYRALRVPGGRKGVVANKPNGDGYVRLCIDYALYQQHRLAWFYMTGEWPKNVIDHINGIRSDNRWTNLRDVPQFMNTQNIRRLQAKNTTGHPGVSLLKGKFRASIRLNGCCTYLGKFATAEEASAAYLAKKREKHPGFIALGGQQ